MNREPLHCRVCARFVPTGRQKRDEDGPGHCEGFDKPVQSTDDRCVLFNERGAWKTRQMQQPSTVTQRPDRRNETISRASAPTAAPT